jgi:predicted transcriptional regulator
MRTTISIDDGLLSRLEADSARTDRTLGSLIEDAVRAAYARQSTANRDLEPLLTFAGSGLMPGVDMTDVASLRDLMDEDEPLDALR